MAFEHHPVFLDPGSNTWFGWQAWSMQRVAEYYYVTADPRVESLLDRWTGWAIAEVQLLSDEQFAIPVTLAWSGEPELWNPLAPAVNERLRVEVLDYNQDVGITASLAKTLMYYAAANTDRQAELAEKAKDMSFELIERLWLKARSEKGLSLPEVRRDYQRFFDPVYIPTSYYGKMPDGSTIDSESTFLSLRQAYEHDPDFPKVKAYIEGGEPPEFHYHRFWAQAAAALAYAEYDRLFLADR